MKHTPTLWYYDEEKGEIRCEERDYLIANIEPQDITEPEDLFNGEHIVKCVNSHDALKSALIKINAWAFTNAYPEIEEVCEQALKAAGETL